MTDKVYNLPLGTDGNCCLHITYPKEGMSHLDAAMMQQLLNLIIEQEFYLPLPESESPPLPPERSTWHD